MLEKARTLIFDSDVNTLQPVDADPTKLWPRHECGTILAWTCRTPVDSMYWMLEAERRGIPALPLRFELSRELHVLGDFQVLASLASHVSLVRTPALAPALKDAYYLNLSSGTSLRRTIAFPRIEQVICNARACMERFQLGTHFWYWCTFPFYAHAHEIFAKGACSHSPILAFPPTSVERANSLLDADCPGLHILTTPHVALNFLAPHLEERHRSRVRFELAGEYVSLGLVKQLQGMGFQVAVSWGSAETTGVALADLNPEQASSIGRPLPSYRVQPDLEGQPGRMEIRGDAVAPFLFQDRVLIETHGHFRSNDQVVLDGGIYRFLGRTDQQLKFQGTYIQVRDTEGWAKSFEAVENAFLCVHDRDNRTHLELYVQCPLRDLWPDIRYHVLTRMREVYGGIKLNIFLTPALSHTPLGKLIRDPAIQQKQIRKET